MLKKIEQLWNENKFKPMKIRNYKWMPGSWFLLMGRFSGGEWYGEDEKGTGLIYSGNIIEWELFEQVEIDEVNG